MLFEGRVCMHATQHVVGDSCGHSSDGCLRFSLSSTSPSTPHVLPPRLVVRRTHAETVNLASIIRFHAF